MWHTALAISLILGQAPDARTTAQLIAKPDARQTLVNPPCSHCRDEARRRAKQLRADDPVLCWIRGKYKGGAIPIRFFLNPYRVISDTYGLFVYDPDAGFARGFAPSLEFTFYGWRNGVMVMKHHDGTLYSCLTGVAFAGPRRGHRLTLLPTLTGAWGFWLKQYPGTVAYHMFDKYQPIELPTNISAESRQSRVATDLRLGESEPVLGVAIGSEARAYPIRSLATQGLIHDELAKKKCDVFWFAPTHTAAAYEPVASAPNGKATRSVDLRRDDQDVDAPFVDRQTGSRWDITGRATTGTLKGWTLRWVDATQVKWYAWAAEYPKTTVHAGPPSRASRLHASPAAPARIMIAGTAEALHAMPKHFARLVDVDALRRRVTLAVEGDSLPKVWQLMPDAEVKVAGWWGRLDELHAGDRVWAWFSLDRRQHPVGIFMLADELSAQVVHGRGVTVKQRRGSSITIQPPEGPARVLDTSQARLFRGKKPADLDSVRPGESLYVQTQGTRAVLILDAAAFLDKRTAQEAVLRQRWRKEGLPGTVMFTHLSGEMEFMADHEAMRWARSLRPGDRVTLGARTPIDCQVRTVRPWRERTQLRLVVAGSDLADLHIGQRLFLKVPQPAADVDASPLPADLDRPRGREDRIEWFLASLYCPCGVGGDTCTGDFYTLASCNPNGCGMPNLIRHKVASMIDQRLGDREILQALLKDYGPRLLSPHLRP